MTSRIVKFIDNRIYGALSIFVIGLAYLKHIWFENVSQSGDAGEELNIAVYKDRFNSMLLVFTKEQEHRLYIYVWWARIGWMFGITMFVLSIINSMYSSIIYYIFFLMGLYFLIGYKIWIFNTKYLVPFNKYLKIFYKYPFASIPYNNFKQRNTREHNRPNS